MEINFAKSLAWVRVSETGHTDSATDNSAHWGNGDDPADSGGALLGGVGTLTGGVNFAVELYPPGSDTGITTFNSLIKANAASLGIDVIDMTSQLNFFQYPAYANADGHPNIAGSQLWLPFVDAWIQSHL